MSTVRGIEMQRNDEHIAKALSPMDESCEPDSNPNSARFAQPSKHRVPIIPTERGSRIDVNAEQPQNANLATVDKQDPGSNVTFNSAVQRLKHNSWRNSTDRGIEIDRRAHPENISETSSEQREFDSNVTLESEQQPRNTARPKASSEHGRWMASSDEQLPKAHSPRRERRDTDSNLTCDRALHLSKHESSILSTVRGMHTDVSAQHDAKAQV
jgi:hypothetical protein